MRDSAQPLSQTGPRPRLELAVGERGLTPRRLRYSNQASASSISSSSSASVVCRASARRSCARPPPDGLPAAAGPGLASPRDVNRQQHADRDQVRDHRRAADAHERKRDARDRRDADRHADVDEDLEEERDDDPARGDRREGVTRDRDRPSARARRRAGRGSRSTATPTKPALLGRRGEREVGRVLGQVVEVRLRRAADPRARARRRRRRALIDWRML